MPIWVQEAIRVTASGAISTVHLTIDDDDPGLTSGEGGVNWRVNGASLASLPILTQGTLTVALANGASLAGTGLRFNLGTDSYYLTDAQTPAAGVTGINSFAATGTALGLDYIARGFVPAAQTPFTGRAVVVNLDAGGVQTGSSTTVHVIHDDDTTLQFAEPGVVDALESGVRPLIQFSGSGDGVPFDAGFDAGTGMILYDIEYDGAFGPGMFRAVGITVPNGTGTNLHLFPEAGFAGLAGVATITSRTIVQYTLTADYAAYGIGSALITNNGTGAADALVGTYFDELMKGFDGADRISGGHGRDMLFGGDGNDRLSGGLHVDTLYGDNGDDSLNGQAFDDFIFGGAGRDRIESGFGDDRANGGDGGDRMVGNAGNDRMFGDAGGDRLTGGKGRDTLDGGTGDDNLSGGDGRDRLIDGTGRDRLTSGLDDDRFVLVNDGQRDTILDFADTVDRIDLTASFAQLTITELQRGEIRVSFGAEVLIVRDTAGVLRASQLTADDFI